MPELNPPRSLAAADRVDEAADAGDGEQHEQRAPARQAALRTAARPRGRCADRRSPEAGRLVRGRRAGRAGVGSGRGVGVLPVVVRAAGRRWPADGRSCPAPSAGRRVRRCRRRGPSSPVDRRAGAAGRRAPAVRAIRHEHSCHPAGRRPMAGIASTLPAEPVDASLAPIGSRSLIDAAAGTARPAGRSARAIARAWAATRLAAPSARRLGRRGRLGELVGRVRASTPGRPRRGRPAAGP